MVERLREATQGCERFMKLVEKYVDIVEAESMKQRAASRAENLKLPCSSTSGFPFLMRQPWGAWRTSVHRNLLRMA